ncbi:MAG: regulatory protein RecX [bacterium]
MKITRIEKQLKEAEDYAYLLLARRDHSCREIYDRLKIKKFPDELIQKVLDKLVRSDYVNDYKFAVQWINNRLKEKPRGEKLIRQELFRKGINKEIIDRAIREEFSRQVPQELELAKRALQKKLPGYKKLAKLVASRRAKSFLVRRGFSYETAEKLTRALFDKNKLDYTD